LVPLLSNSRSNSTILADVDRLLGPKTLAELVVLEKQINKKLQSNEPIDVEYWEQLLRSVGVCKAKADLNHVYKSIIESRLNDLWQEQRVEALQLQQKLAGLVESPSSVNEGGSGIRASEEIQPLTYTRDVDPEPFLKLRNEDKGFDVLGEQDFLEKIVSRRMMCTTFQLLTSSQ